jgi:hypothetical protein
MGPRTQEMAEPLVPSDKDNTEQPAGTLIEGQGEMATLIRAYNWRKTSLGPIETWSETLVTTHCCPVIS